MNEVNQTLYIPLYGKAYVSKQNIIIQDKKAEDIIAQSHFTLKRKSQSKWLAYFMAMRAALFDEYTHQHIHNVDIVLHIGCGLDSRYERINNQNILWYDIDFDEVIKERKKFYHENNNYYMKAFDMRQNDWMIEIEGHKNALIILEGISMYFKEDELNKLLCHINEHFNHVYILMDVYSQKAAKLSRYKNPINDVGVTQVYGYDDPLQLITHTNLSFIKEHNMTPQIYINELKNPDKFIFKYLFASSFSKSLYKTYEFSK